MLVELFVFFEIVIVGLFFTAFFTKQEIIWAIEVIISAVMMANSYTIETYVYHFNMTSFSYYPVLVVNSYPYLMGINSIFFGLGLILLLFDIFEKYGVKFMKRNEGKNQKPTE